MAKRNGNKNEVEATKVETTEATGTVEATTEETVNVETGEIKIKKDADLTKIANRIKKLAVDAIVGDEAAKQQLESYRATIEGLNNLITKITSL